MARMNGPHERVDSHSAFIFDPDAPRGPGWFDSSWELGHGLEVREGLPADATVLEWLEVHMPCRG
ncbi:MAG TPA: hypothetical protein VJO99_09155 [Burkholderiaceae bacterium]|nr:hypothetical protein [Burkholderiaceae bacterium]